MNYDLLICVRCHCSPDEVLDTIHSIEWSCSPRSTCVVCAVDGVYDVFRSLKKEIEQQRIFFSPVRWGWGVGLYGLLSETVKEFLRRYSFSHFLSVDYDVLFVKERVDFDLLSLINRIDIGLVGRYKACDRDWQKIFHRDEKAIIDNLGRIPPTYVPGEAIQGGAMLLTRSLIEAFSVRGYFDPPFSTARNITTLSDDHILPLYCRMAGLDIVNAGPLINCAWRSIKSPGGLHRRTKIFHIDCNTEGYVKIRKHYRRMRNEGGVLHQVESEVCT